MEILERFAQDDLEAFEALFPQFQGEVYAWIVRIVRERGIVEGLTVETFWRIYRAHARFHPEGELPCLAAEDRDECNVRPSEDSPLPELVS
jgi:DNA-directed RNA polymerase specialized sigma24 family protein